MNNVSRRTFLARTTLAAATAYGVSRSAAAEKAVAATTASVASATSHPMAQNTAPAVYRHAVGEIELLSVTDGSVTFPRRDDFVSNIPPATVARALHEAFFPTDAITLTFTPAVVKTQGQLVVIDTGLGEAAFRQSRGVGGQFHTNLAAAGHSAAAVDKVLITHFHADHIGGLVTADGKPAFPNAEIWVSDAEYGFWMDSAQMARATSEGMKANFERARRIFGILGNSVKQFQPNAEVAPGVTALATHGHTPGHTSFVVASGTDKVLIQGDATTHPALFIRHPGWHGATDMDPVLAEKTRRTLYDKAVAERMLVHGFHFPFPALGHLVRDGDGYRMVPVMWNPASLKLPA